MPYLTYQDCVEHLITSSFGGPQDAEQKDIRAAVQRAYQEVAWIRDWQFYHRTGRIVFSPLWSGGVSYNASTRTITRTSGDAFPADAAKCRIRIKNVVAKVASRTDSNTLVLDTELKFPQDFDSGTTALLYRSVYPLPSDFRNIDSPVDELSWSGFRYVSQDAAMKLERAQDIQGPPVYWTIIKDPDSFGYAIQLIGYPVTAETLDFTYRRTPRVMRISGYEETSRSGSLTGVDASPTGSGTAFSSSMVGSVIRNGPGGVAPGPLWSLNPYVTEARILSVAGLTSMTVDYPLLPGTGYVISDPVDMPAGMHNCMLSACEYWLARIRKTDEQKAFAAYQRDLRLAMENDSLTPSAGAERVIWDSHGWRTPLQADNFDGGNP